MSDEKREYADYPGRTWGQRMDNDYQAILRVAKLVRYRKCRHGWNIIENCPTCHSDEELRDALKDVEHLL